MENWRFEWQYVDVYKKNDVYKISNPLKIETGDFFDTLTPNVERELSEMSSKVPIDMYDLGTEVIHEIRLSLERIKGGYGLVAHEIKLIEKVIQDPRSDVAELLQEEIKAKFDLDIIHKSH